MHPRPHLEEPGAAWTPWTPWKRAAAFAILFIIYQSAEGVGGRLLHSFAVQAGLMTAALVAAWPVGRLLLGQPGYRAYGLAWNRRAGVVLLAGLLLAALAKLAAMALGVWAGVYSVVKVQVLPLPALVGVIAFGLVATFIASTTEDIVTRGVLWGAIARRYRTVVFVGASALIYVLNHIYRLGAGPLEWGMLLSFGLAYGAGAACTGTLWGAVGLHWGWNLTNTLLDTVLTVDADPATARYVSIGAHVFMLLAVVSMAWQRQLGRPSRRSAVMGAPTSRR